MNEIGVGVDGCVAVATRIGYVGAVCDDVQRVARQAIVGIGVVQRALAAGVPVGVYAYDLAGIVGLV